MKRQIKIILCIAVIVCSCVCSYVLLARNHEQRQYDSNKMEIRKCYEPNLILLGSVTGDNWDNLALSDSFRNKYKTKGDIIPNIDTYAAFRNGYANIDGKECIVIIADTPNSIFDLLGVNKVETYFYFDYKLTENNEIDDIQLVKIENVNALSGKEIKSE